MSRLRTPLPWFAAFLAFLLHAPTPLSAQETPPRPVLSYTIACTDRLRIAVYQEDDLSVIARVDAKGTVNLPLVGEVTIVGQTVSEAQKTIETAYRKGRYLSKRSRLVFSPWAVRRR